MHHWLFDQKGTFTSEQAIEAGVRAIGRDPGRFVATMTGEEPLEGIAEDIREARLIGLFQTPMIFVNGVELRGWQVPDALTRAVEAVLASDPEPRTHAQDRAPLAVEKCVGDWLDPRNRARSFPPDEHRTILGAEEAAVRVVLFGDFQEPTCAEADQIIRAWMAGRDDARYVWRHFPVDRSCNPNVGKTQMPRGCWASRTAEAAASLGDPALYWRVHDWLIRHPGSLDDASLRAAARELEVDVDRLLAARRGPGIDEAIREDVNAGKRMALRSVPLIFVNERQVVRWRWLGKESGERILQAILEEAAKG
jgi:protein-disulfide isomerase